MASEDASGWAGSVMKKSNSSIWVGALKNAKNAKKTKQIVTNRRTEGLIDQPTDIAGFKTKKITVLVFDNHET